MSLPATVARGVVGPFDRQLDLLNRFVNGGWPEAADRPAHYHVDVREVGDQLVFEAELPGFAKEQIDITVENGVMTLTAERREGSERKDDQGTYLLNERRYGRFARAFKLPPTVDEKGVQAKLENGVLTVTLGRREESKPRKIVVA